MHAVIADTSLFVALFDSSDRHHHSAKDYLQRLSAPLITNIPVITETVHMLDFHPKVATDFLRWVPKATDIDGNSHNDMSRIEQVFTKYRDLPADFTDASLVALSERLGTQRIATLDSDFHIYRFKDKTAFDIEFRA